MEIQLLNTGSDPRVISKGYTSLKITNATPIGEFSIQAPVLKLSYGDWSVGNANYVYIPDYLRYYYIDDITIHSGKYVLIKCRCDVLMSFANAILNCTALCVRSETAGTNEIIDRELPLKPKKDITVSAFKGGAFNLNTATEYSLNFVLNVAGGAGTNPEPEEE